MKNRMSFVCLVILLFLISGHFSKLQAATPGLIGLWTLNDTGTTATNTGSLGSVVDGLLSGISNPSTSDSGWTAGKFGGALNFDGVNDTVNLGSDAGVDDLFKNDLTFSALVKPTDCSARYLATKSSGTPLGFYIFSSNGSCNPRIDVYNATTRALYIAAPDSIVAGEWSQITFVWNALTKTAKIYVNGVEVQYSTQTAGAGEYVSDAAYNFLFGNWHASAGNAFYHGALDQVKLYNYAQTPAQVGYWNFNGNSGTLASNTGTAGALLNGTLVGFANPATTTSGWSSDARGGQALAFDGINDAVNMGSQTVIDDLFTNDLTFSAWLRPTSCNSTRFIAGKNSGGPTGFYLYSSNGSCNPRIDVYHMGTRATYISALNSITPGEWNHVAFVWNASSKMAKIYVNGTEVSYSLQTPGVGEYKSDALADLAIGNWHSAAGTQFYQGIMDQVRLYNYAQNSDQIASDIGYGTSFAKPVVLIRKSPTTFLIRVQIPTSYEGDFAEYDMQNISSNIWAIQALRASDTYGDHQTFTLSQSDSVWEYGYKLGVAGDLDDVSNWGYYGGWHNNQRSTSFSIHMDGVNEDALPVGKAVRGSALTVDQTMDILLPKDNSITVGSVHLTHQFDHDQLLVSHSHAYSPGYEIYDSYSATLPTTGATSGGINMIQIGSNPPYSIQYDGVKHYPETTSTSALAWNTGHPYAIKMSLPSGGPDVNGDWSHDTETERMWLNDFAVGSYISYAKVYTNWVSRHYVDRIPATASFHQTKYEVLKLQ